MTNILLLKYFQIDIVNLTFFKIAKLIELISKMIVSMSKLIESMSKLITNYTYYYT